MSSVEKTFNQSFSCIAPMVVPVDLDFRAGETAEADLTQLVALGQIDFINSLYINLKDAAFDMEITPNVLSQVVWVRQGHIQYVPIFLGSAPKFTATISAPLNSVFQILATNIPFFPFDLDAT